MNALERYRKKRNLSRSGEPAGRLHERRARQPTYVVQHHCASTDHYDFRLEVDGVLKSWAVPKGPSVNPKDKRMAQPTEDHPLDYAEFEGVIPDEAYGAGTVQVWDRGHYENRTKDHGDEVEMAEGLKRGHVSFELDGDKLRGGFALTRMRSGKGESWLLVKKKDEHAQARGQPVRSSPESALSGRTLEEIADSEWASRRRDS